MLDTEIPAGDHIVECAFDPKTCMYVAFALQEHSQFADWAKQMIQDGCEIHSMTVAQVVDWLDANPMDEDALSNQEKRG